MSARRSRSRMSRRLCLAAAALVLVAACAGDRDAQVADVRALQEANRFHEALPILEALLEDEPADRELNHLYGLNLMAMGHHAAAIWPLDRATRAPDAGIEDRVLLAQAHLRGGSPEEAVRAAEVVLSEAPNVLEALQVRIDAHRKLERHEEALADVETILGFEPEQRDALLAQAELLLLLERTEEAEAALQAARQVVSRAGEDASWVARFCAIDATFILEREEEDHLAEATAAWEGCLEAHPTDPLVVSQTVAFFQEQGAPRAQSGDPAECRRARTGRRRFQARPGAAAARPGRRRRGGAPADRRHRAAPGREGLAHPRELLRGPT